MYPILKMVNKKNFLPSYLLDDDDVRDELFSALLSLLRAQQVSVSAESSFWKGAMQCTGLSVNGADGGGTTNTMYILMYVVVRLHDRHPLVGSSRLPMLLRPSLAAVLV